MRGLALAAEGALGLDEQKGRGVRAQTIIIGSDIIEGASCVF
jgi:hypothetical protein